MEFNIKKSQFRVKSRFKEWKGPDGGHSLNRDILYYNLFTLNQDSFVVYF